MHHEYMNCQYSAQYMNNLETNTIYRNHILAFKQLQIWNGQHRKQSVSNCNAVFPIVLSDHIQTLPAPLKHCAYSKVKPYRAADENFLHFNMYLHIGKGSSSQHAPRFWNRCR